LWKIRKEEYLYNLIRKKTDVPIPKVIKAGRDYLLMTKIRGRELDVSNEALVKKAGEYLAKIHSIKFPSYGWIIRDKIKPKFKNWIDFVKYDMDLKFKNIPKKDEWLKDVIKHILKEHRSLFNVKDGPCLLHKDYHSSHILVDKGKISGIIDIEWAMAGHNEMDLVKSLLWMFEDKPKLEKVFLEGYKKYGHVSKEFGDRRKIYNLLVLVSALSFSHECKNKKWCNYNLKKLKVAVNEYNKNN